MSIWSGTLVVNGVKKSLWHLFYEWAWTASRLQNHYEQTLLLITKTPSDSSYKQNRPWKDEMLSRSLSHSVVLNVDFSHLEKNCMQVFARDLNCASMRRWNGYCDYTFLLRYRISSNKRRASNKHRPLISPAPLIMQRL